MEGLRKARDEYHILLRCSILSEGRAERILNWGFSLLSCNPPVLPTLLGDDKRIEGIHLREPP